MKKIFFLVAMAAATAACAQTKSTLFSETEATRIENVLASDEMRGRRAGSPEIDKAAAFIAEEFRKAGLQPLKGTSFLQDFVMVRPKQTTLKAEMEGVEMDPKSVVVVTTQREVKVNEKSGYEVVQLAAGENFQGRVQGVMAAKKNAIVFVDTSFTRNFSRLNGLKRQMFAAAHTVVFVLGTKQPKEYTIKAEHTLEESRFANVVGVLPGKSRKGEYVIFSGHYDHVGVGRAVNGDSIYNGANDDAAGITAVIMLADHFKKKGDNARTLVFAAFTAEEIGGFGSQYFSRQLDPVAVAAMFNIEMIGTESKWGANSAYITGFDKSSMGTILQKNLHGSAFTFHPDPYEKENLFYRSDNATLARLGVPAHTISTAKMENEPNYHKPSDEVATLDITNMTRIMEAIAKSSATIISGQDTPTRVKDVQ